LHVFEIIEDEFPCVSRSISDTFRHSHGPPNFAKISKIDIYIDNRYTDIVIRSIKGQLTQDVFDGKNSKIARKLDQNIHAIAKRKLDQLNAAVRLDDFRIPPGNRLEALSGDLKGLHSIRINDQWRIVFHWTSTGPEEVRIEDYH
jgi:proteic killer suppression protein